MPSCHTRVPRIITAYLFTHQVDFFLQVVHVLVPLPLPLPLLAFLFVAIGGCRQFVLLFASLDGRR